LLTPPPSSQIRELPSWAQAMMVTHMNCCFISTGILKKNNGRLQKTKKSNWNFPIWVGGWFPKGSFSNLKRKEEKSCFKIIYML
jgi:hypothetical protein